PYAASALAPHQDAGVTTTQERSSNAASAASRRVESSRRPQAPVASQEETGPVDESRATLSARRAHSWVAVVAVSIALASCATSSSPADDTALGDDAITVGSFNFGESQLLAEIYAQALEQRGFTIER